MWVGELSFGCTLKTDKKQRVFGGEGGEQQHLTRMRMRSSVSQPASQPAGSGATGQRVRLTGQRDDRAECVLMTMC